MLPPLRAPARCGRRRRGARPVHHRRADLFGDRDHLRSRRGPRGGAGIASASADAACSRLPPNTMCSLGATGTHPWADYRDQQVIDTEHYRRVAAGPRYVARRNNTFSLHVHVGVRDIDRAVRVCDRLREASCRSCLRSLPTRRTSTAATAVCTPRAHRSSRRASRAAAYPTRSAAGANTAATSKRWSPSGSIVEFTQIWWSVRPHVRFGTVEVRICDVQMTAAESDALASLIVACVAQAARDVDEGRPYDTVPRRLVEENMWRATRFGLDGKLVDFTAGVQFPAREAVDRLLAWTAPSARSSGSTSSLPRAQRRPAPARDDRPGGVASGCLR